MIRTILMALAALGAGTGGLEAAKSNFHSSHVSGGGRLSAFHGGAGGHFHGWWGPGWWGPGWWWGWGYPYGYGYPYPYRYDAAARSSWTRVKTDVEPDEAALYLDGRLIGTADDFDGWPDVLYLQPGRYNLEFRLDGFENFAIDIDAAPGAFFRMNQKMKRIPGARHVGTYKPARPEGGVIRYFSKRIGEDQADRDSRDDGGSQPRPGRAILAPPSRKPMTSTDVVVSAASEARVVFQIAPEDSAVYLDDHFAGSARDLNRMSNGISVSAGHHKVTVTRPGFTDQTITVEASEGNKISATVSLAVSAESH